MQNYEKPKFLGLSSEVIHNRYDFDFPSSSRDQNPEIFIIGTRTLEAFNTVSSNLLAYCI